MMKKVVVTGGAGFVGSNLVRRLLKDNYAVYLLVRKGGSLWRLKDILKDVTIYEGKLSNKESLRKLMRKISPEAIYHLATYGSYPNQKDMKKIIAVNLAGTINLLNSLKDIPYKQLIVAGSSSEYGKKQQAMKEDNLLEPNNFYAVFKAAQTHLCQVFSKTYHKPLVIFRLFSVYGYFEEKGRLVRSVIESVKERKPILLATGREARDFIFADDVADAFITATEKNRPFEGEIFNIGTGVQTTIKELAEAVMIISGIKVPVRLNAYEGRPWDSHHWVADMKKTHTLLQWQSKYSLEEGLKKTIQWYWQRQQ